MAGITNDILSADNVNFSGDNPTIGEVTTNGQLLIGSTAAPNIKVGTLISPNSTITIGYSNPNITLDLAGGQEAIDSIGVDTGTSPIVPNASGLVNINGTTVAAGTNPVRTDGTASNTMAIEVQISQAIASADATKIGLCNFDSSQFSVDADGFVTSSSLSPFAWTDEATSFNATAQMGYFVTDTATATLPASPAQGDTISFACDTANVLTIQANTAQFIRVGSGLSSSAGTCASNAIGDSLTLVYRSSDATWIASSVIGTWTLA